MPEVTLRDFSGGLVDYFSPTDISDKQFQLFDGLENERLGRLELLKIPKNVASDIEESSAQSYTGGYGFFNGLPEWPNIGGLNSGALFRSGNAGAGPSVLCVV